MCALRKWRQVDGRELKTSLVYIVRHCVKNKPASQPAVGMAVVHTWTHTAGKAETSSSLGLTGQLGQPAVSSRPVKQSASLSSLQDKTGGQYPRNKQYLKSPKHVRIFVHTHQHIGAPPHIQTANSALSMWSWAVTRVLLLHPQ